MPLFFEKVSGNSINITGENANHISSSLRMKPGEIITLCDNGINHECEIISVEKSEVTAKVINSYKNESEPNINISLFQCIPKGDKLDLVIQKAVELGVSEIIPVLSSRCVSRPDNKKANKKNERYNKIARCACEQAGRGKLVTVGNQIDFKSAVNQISKFDLAILFYEGGGSSLKSIIKTSDSKNICIFIGPEGGFSDSEVEMLKNSGAKIATLGKRILRTETAPLAALVSIMMLTGNME